MSIRELIREQVRQFLAEQDPEKEKAEKEKQDLDQQKQDLAQQKLDFQKQQAADNDREADQRDAEKEKADQEKEKEGEKGEGGGSEEQKPEPNISFKTQGTFYKEALANLNNLSLSNGDLLDDEEKHYVALAVQAAEGRFDKEFKRLLQKGKAGNVYGKDFSDDDIKSIMKFCKRHDIVR